MTDEPIETPDEQPERRVTVPRGRPHPGRGRKIIGSFRFSETAGIRTRRFFPGLG